MPFVPLGSRRRLEVVLDEDKEMIASRQLEKDMATIRTHTGVSPGASGYRFANHPATRGDFRGPDVPFKGATSTWRPPEVDPEGPAGQRAREQADASPAWLATSTLRKTTRSSPNLMSPNKCEAIQAAHPLSIEINRWERIAHTTMKTELKDVEVIKRQPELPPPKVHKVGGLVNFPKYMLINNCWLKQQDLQRFQRQQEELTRQAAEEAQVLASSASTPTLREAARSSVKLYEASWGAPKLKDEGHHWAGNALPSGRCQRTSNPFRMG